MFPRMANNQDDGTSRVKHGWTSIAAFAAPVREHRADARRLSPQNGKLVGTIYRGAKHPPPIGHSPCRLARGRTVQRGVGGRRRTLFRFRRFGRFLSAEKGSPVFRREGIALRAFLAGFRVVLVRDTDAALALSSMSGCDSASLTMPASFADFGRPSRVTVYPSTLTVSLDALERLARNSSRSNMVEPPLRHLSLASASRLA